MSVEPEARELAASSLSPQSLDLTGLPASVANELQRLVATLRDNLGHASTPSTSPAKESPEAWAQRLQTWVDTHTAEATTMDDSRESIYAGRGE
jgi:hypothetical protein